jgi:hypothetical protein
MSFRNAWFLAGIDRIHTAQHPKTEQALLKPEGGTMSFRNT